MEDAQKSWLAGMFTNYDIDLPTWNKIGRREGGKEEQLKIASAYKNKKASEQLNDPTYKTEFGKSIETDEPGIIMRNLGEAVDSIKGGFKSAGEWSDSVGLTGGSDELAEEFNKENTPAISLNLDLKKQNARDDARREVALNTPSMKKVVDPMAKQFDQESFIKPNYRELIAKVGGGQVPVWMDEDAPAVEVDGSGFDSQEGSGLMNLGERPEVAEKVITEKPEVVAKKKEVNKADTKAKQAATIVEKKVRELEAVVDKEGKKAVIKKEGLMNIGSTDFDNDSFIAEDIKSITKAEAEKESPSYSIEPSKEPAYKKNVWTNPYTGQKVDYGKLAYNYNQKKKLAKDTKIASFLSPSAKMLYLAEKGHFKGVSPKMLKAILKPSEKKTLDLAVAQMNLEVKASQLELNRKKNKDYMSPQTDQYWKSYRAAVADNNPQSILTFGKLLNLDKATLDNIITEGNRIANAKVSSKDKNKFQSRFSVPYTKIMSERASIMKSTSSVFEPGMMGSIEVGGKTYTGRKGVMNNFGFKELDEIRPSSFNKTEYFKRLKTNYRTEFDRFFNRPRFMNKDKTPNYGAVLDDPMAYQNFLQNMLIDAHMMQITSGEYTEMERFRLKLKNADKQREEDLSKKVAGKIK